MKYRKILLEYYQTAFDCLGESNWWPAETALEVCFGAILTQNTTWKNAFAAIENLKKNNYLDIDIFLSRPKEEILELLRPAGYFRAKYEYLSNFLYFVQQELEGNILLLQNKPLELAREKLLSIKGIGPETADSILLYALDFPIFVVDAYTKRIFNRHGLLTSDVYYAEMQDFFMTALQNDAHIFNEFHALIVRVASTYCKTKAPLCAKCPFCSLLPAGELFCE